MKFIYCIFVTCLHFYPALCQSNDYGYPEDVSLSVQEKHREKVKSVVEEFLISIITEDSNKFEYLSNDFLSLWSKRCKNYKTTITQFGEYKNNRIFFAVVEGRWLRSTSTSLKPFADVIYIKARRGELFIDESLSHSDLEHQVRSSFNSRENYGKQIQLPDNIFTNDTLWFKKMAKPDHMSNDEWETSWELIYESKKKVWEKQDRENDKLNNRLYRSYNTLNERVDIHKLKSDLKYVCIPSEPSFKSLVKAVKTHITYNILMLKSNKFYEAWKWDKDYVEKELKEMENIYTEKILLSGHISFTALLRYKLHFYTEFHFRGSTYNVVFVSFHQDFGHKFNVVKDKYALDEKFIGFAFMSFLVKDDEYILVKTPKDKLFFDEFLRRLTSNLFNRVEAHKKINVDDVLQDLGFPDSVINDVVLSGANVNKK